MPGLTVGMTYMMAVRRTTQTAIGRHESSFNSISFQTDPVRRSASLLKKRRDILLKHEIPGRLAQGISNSIGFSRIPHRDTVDTVSRGPDSDELGRVAEGLMTVQQYCENFNSWQTRSIP